MIHFDFLPTPLREYEKGWCEAFGCGWVLCIFHCLLLYVEIDIGGFISNDLWNIFRKRDYFLFSLWCTLRTFLNLPVFVSWAILYEFSKKESVRWIEKTKGASTRFRWINLRGCHRLSFRCNTFVYPPWLSYPNIHVARVVKSSTSHQLPWRHWLPVTNKRRIRLIDLHYIWNVWLLFIWTSRADACNKASNDNFTQHMCLPPYIYQTWAHMYDSDDDTTMNEP